MTFVCVRLCVHRCVRLLFFHYEHELNYSSDFFVINANESNDIWLSFFRQINSRYRITCDSSSNILSITKNNDILKRNICMLSRCIESRDGGMSAAITIQLSKLSGLVYEKSDSTILCASFIRLIYITHSVRWALSHTVYLSRAECTTHHFNSICIKWSKKKETKCDCAQIQWTGIVAVAARWKLNNTPTEPKWIRIHGELIDQRNYIANNVPRIQAPQK